MSYNQYKGVIHKHLVKDDPCWENYEMVGTKVQDGKEVPNCVPKKEKDDEPIEKYDEKTYIKHANKAVNYIQQSKTMSGSGAKWQRLRDAKREIDLALEVLGKK
tara:strand:- start:660 stop:971 length:312 start_codon:yes stop_codon:yes gene_type:complete